MDIRAPTIFRDMDIRAPTIFRAQRSQSKKEKMANDNSKETWILDLISPIEKIQCNIPNRPRWA